MRRAPTARCLHVGTREEDVMARGSKKSYTSKQRRQARHIEDSAKSRGKSSARAKQIAYATVNKQGGGKKRGGGRKRSMASSRMGGRKGARR
jgi:hypothetical protein